MIINKEKEDKHKGRHNLIFMDCEASGPCIGKGNLTEFGAVAYSSMKTFYGDLRPSFILPATSGAKFDRVMQMDIFYQFDAWLKEVCKGFQPIFVSDNPAFDFPWINYHFHHLLGRNPFGWSARRIGDYYAGLTNNWRNASKWKKLRITKHTHNPVDDAMGNVEAFKRIEEGER